MMEPNADQLKAPESKPGIMHIKSLSVNNANFLPADNGCCQMMQGNITGIGFLKANQELTKPVEP